MDQLDGGQGGKIRKELVFKGYLEGDFVCLESKVSYMVPFCRKREKWDVFNC